MKTGLMTLRSLEQIARVHGYRTLLAGGLLVIFLLAGQGAFHDGFRFAGFVVTTGLVEA